MAQFQFDARGIPPQESFDALPAGWYKALVEASEVKPTKEGTGTYLQVTYVILEGFAKGRKVFGRFNIQNANPQAVEIGMRQLSALAHAIGVLVVQDSQQLHGIPFNVRLKVEKGDGTYADKNEAVGWKNAGEQVQYAEPAPPRAQQPTYAQVNNAAPANAAPVGWQQPGGAPPAAPQWNPPAGQQAPPVQQQYQPQAHAPQQAPPAPPAPPAWQQPQQAQPWGQPAAPAAAAPAAAPAGVAAAQTSAPPWQQQR